MKTIKLYYPAFVEIDGEPEKMNFDTPEDWKADEAIYRRMYKDDGTMRLNRNGSVAGIILTCSRNFPPAPTTALPY